MLGTIKNDKLSRTNDKHESKLSQGDKRRSQTLNESSFAMMNSSAEKSLPLIDSFNNDGVEDDGDASSLNHATGRFGIVLTSHSFNESQLIRPINDFEVDCEPPINTNRLTSTIMADF